MFVEIIWKHIHTFIYSEIKMSLFSFQYISLFVEDLPIEVFEQFMVHMSKCAAAHRASAERENRRIILTNLFILCDHGGVSRQG